MNLKSNAEFGEYSKLKFKVDLREYMNPKNTLQPVEDYVDKEFLKFKKKLKQKYSLISQKQFEIKLQDVLNSWNKEFELFHNSISEKFFSFLGEDIENFNKNQLICLRKNNDEFSFDLNFSLNVSSSREKEINKFIKEINFKYSEKYFRVKMKYISLLKKYILNSFLFYIELNIWNDYLPEYYEASGSSGFYIIDFKWFFKRFVKEVEKEILLKSKKNQFCNYERKLKRILFSFDIDISYPTIQTNEPSYFENQFVFSKLAESLSFKTPTLNIEEPLNITAPFYEDLKDHEYNFPRFYIEGLLMFYIKKRYPGIEKQPEYLFKKEDFKIESF